MAFSCVCLAVRDPEVASLNQSDNLSQKNAEKALGRFTEKTRELMRITTVQFSFFSECCGEDNEGLVFRLPVTFCWFFDKDLDKESAKVKAEELKSALTSVGFDEQDPAFQFEEIIIAEADPNDYYLEKILYELYID